MGPDIQKKILFSFIVSIFVITGCSNNLNELKSSSISVIFDYQDSESLPGVHLAAFAEPSLNVRKCQEISIVSNSSDYEWTTEDVIKFQFNNRYYAGYTNFIMPEGLEIPDGNYEFIYTDATGAQIKYYKQLIYDHAFYKTKSDKVMDIINNGNFDQKFAIYDENQKLLYFGDFNNEHKSDSNIKTRYEGAYTKRFIWVSKNNSVFCIMPPEKINAETK